MNNGTLPHSFIAFHFSFITIQYSFIAIQFSVSVIYDSLLQIHPLALLSSHCTYHSPW